MPTSDEEEHDVNVLMTGPTGYAGAPIADALLAAERADWTTVGWRGR